MKRVKRYVILLVCVMLLSGCFKNDTTMKINKDKSMNLEVTLTVEDQYKSTLSSNFDSADIEKRGFKVTTINNDDYSGYKITKKYNNIDELSKSDNKPLEISNILDSDFDTTKLFSKTGNYFFETYTANYTYSIDTFKNKYLISEDDEDSLEEDNRLKGIELTYTVVLPSKAKSNNANDNNDGGKKLIWKLSTNTDNKINYSFVIYNIKNIAIVGGGTLLLLIIIIIIIAVIRKKKASTSSLIYKEYDPSIESELNKNEIIKDEEPKNLQVPEENLKKEEVVVTENKVNQPSDTFINAPKLDSLEYNLPSEQTANHIEIEEKKNQFVTGDNIVIPQVQPTYIKGVQPSSPVEEVKPQVVAEEVKPQVVVEEKVILETPTVTPSLQNINPQVNNVSQPEPQVQANTFDYNKAPDFVRQNDTNKFIQEEVERQSQPQSGGFDSPKLDIPNATALSDMQDYK